MKKNYPFDPSIKSHFIIAIGLAIWIFVFLYFTEPLDVNEFGDKEKLIYLPLYGVLGAILYLTVLPFQYFLSKKGKWSLVKELCFLIVFIIISIAFLRLFYLHVIMEWNPKAYTFGYHLRAILFPATLTILPIVVVGRYAFGKYKNKKIEAKKIEIEGEGNYESLRLLLNDLVCVKSSDNYIEVYYLNGQSLKKSLIRNKLNVIEESFSELLRCHRSYVINPFHFQSWKIEKGKHFLTLSHDIIIPVSKTFIETVKDKLNFTTE
ncbi:MAG: LytTR family DNA-binding domain-containing protein [Flavobacteriaceae bacterium]